jgi:hypothetical protein
MSRLRMLQVWIATVVLSTGLTVVPGLRLATRPLTGKVSDAMCGLRSRPKSRAQPMAIPSQ